MRNRTEGDPAGQGEITRRDLGVLKPSRQQLAERVAAVLSGVRQPVVPILLLIAFFTAISGKPLDGVLLLLVAVGLAWDAGARSPAAAARPAGDDTGPRRRPVLVLCGIAGAAAYAAVVGTFARYSWPATVAIAGLGSAAVAVGWHGRLAHRPVPAKLPVVGAVLWAALLVAAGLWELAALLLQPNLTTDSYAHPTISTLTDPLLASHGGRSVVLGLWLALGWWLSRR